MRLKKYYPMSGLLWKEKRVNKWINYKKNSCKGC